MKRIKILFSLMALVAIMVSCNKEETDSVDGFGMISFRNIGVDTDVVSTIVSSRNGDGEDNGESDGNESGGETEKPSDPMEESLKNGFKLSVKAYDETVYACTDYEKFINGECENIELRAGKYTVVAELGNSDVEGFNEPYYSGSKDIQLRKGENENVDIECKLANSILKIIYTDKFKEYFSAYSASVTTSKGNNVNYVQDEERGAYLASGEITVYVNAKKTGGKEATFNVGKYILEPQYEYALTLDVDAGNAVMTVTFSETINEEPVKINVSDEAFNVNPPYMVGEGFVGGEEINIVEGVFPSESLRVLINAEAEIASCVMTTNSEYLTVNGWKESIDLVSADEQSLAVIRNSGVDLKGLSGSLSKMAFIDFTGLVSSLPKENPIDIKLTVTDKFGKTSEMFKFLAKTTDCMFNVYPTNEEVSFMSNECKVFVTLLEGDVDNIKFALTDGGQELDVQEISEPTKVGDVNQYTVLLKGNDDTQFINPFKVNAKYLSYNKDTEDLNVSYGILLDNGEGDVWAKRAYMHVYNVPQDDIQYLKVQKKEVNGDWTDIDTQNVEVSGTNLIVKGLVSNTQQQLRVVKDGKEPTNVLDIKTEEELQVPNAGFEEWNVYQTWTSDKFGGKKIYAYSFYIDENTKFWETSNNITTKKLDGTYYSWYYAVYPSAIPTMATEMNTASWHLNKYDGKQFKIESHSGSTAVELATVGWGFNNWGPSGGTGPQRVTAGSLFIGNLDGENELLGKEFSSRPSKVSFWAKYYSYMNEFSTPCIEVYNKNKELIGSGSINISETSDSFHNYVIDVDYNKNEKASFVSIIFRSTNSQSPATKQVVGNNGLFSGYGDSRHIGSILTVDDVQLIYE